MTTLFASILILPCLINLSIFHLRGLITIEQLKKLEKLIEELRTQLYDIINKKDGDLLSPEVVTASKMLDSALNTYRELIKESKHLE